MLRKARESARVTEELLTRDAEKLERCARAMAERFERGARLWTFGNGGSACDAEHLAVEFQHPILEKRRALPATALTTDTALMTAIGNDTDFTMIFADQVALLGAPGDIALGISSSGQSANVVRGIERARQLGMLTIGLAGRDGGRLAQVVEHVFVAPSFSTHRIQETHVLLLHLLWDQLHVALGAEDVL